MFLSHIERIGLKTGRTDVNICVNMMFKYWWNCPDSMQQDSEYQLGNLTKENVFRSSASYRICYSRNAANEAPFLLTQDLCTWNYSMGVVFKCPTKCFQLQWDFLNIFFENWINWSKILHFKWSIIQNRWNLFQSNSNP